ncbi:uncharacterized protein LOC142473008 [Ascaphus truei]|uniref:uncharacterized protein LOC142473008 n=1 Tax=Ascaphus truei TaxID=8439 RepID=UPI003F5A6F0E
MERKRVRVDGIPTDIPAERAKDKLTIHFLRHRNGGGDPEEIEILPGPPAYALVTFEEAKVVERVLQVKDHMLTMNGKSYLLKVSEPSDKLEPDEVFLKSSLTVNYKKFPEGYKNPMKCLSKIHKDVLFNFDHEEKTCTVSGAYTKIQTLSQEILKIVGLGCEDSKRGPPEVESKEHFKAKHNSPSPQLRDTILQRQTEDQVHSTLYAGADLKKYPSRGDPIEQVADPLIWDSDIYKYMLTFHNDEYQHILYKHQVQAVDASSEGITSLYLQAAAEIHGQAIDMSNARGDLLLLYQGLELELRKEQISKKEIKGDRDRMKTLFRDLQKLFPMLLCHEDERYLYFIGNAADVTLAKQYINDIQFQKDIPKSLKISEMFSGAQVALNQRKPKTRPLMESKPHSHRYASSEAKGDNKIAARFNPPKSLISSPQWEPAGATKYMEQPANTERRLQEKEYEKGERPDQNADSLRRYVREEPLVKDEDDGVSQAKATDKSTTQVKGWDVIPSPNAEKDGMSQRTWTSRGVGPVKPLPLFNPSSELQYSSLTDMNTYPVDYKASETKTTLRRSNSFSRVYSRDGSVSDRQVDVVQDYLKDSATAQHEDLIATDDFVFVNHMVWSYMKDLHKSDIEVMCSGVLLSEEQKKDFTILKLKATNRSKLLLAKESIQSLYNELSINTTFQSFSYSVLEVQGPGDRALESLCSAFLKCSNKLRIRLEKYKMDLTYPKEIQSNVYEEHRRFLESKRMSPSLWSSSLANDSQVSLGSPEKIEPGNEPDVLDNRSHDHGLDFQHSKCHSSEFLSDSLHTNSQSRTPSSDTRTGDVASETSQFQGIKGLGNLGDTDQNIFLVGDYKLTAMGDASTNLFKYPKSSSQESSPSDIQSPTHPKELQDFSKVDTFIEEPDLYKAKRALPNKFQLDKSRTKDSFEDDTVGFRSHVHIHDNTYQSLPHQINSPTQDVKERVMLTSREVGEDCKQENLILNKDLTLQEETSAAELRSPAVGQEAENTDTSCDRCKNDYVTIKVSCGHSLCNNCLSSTNYACQVCLGSSTPNANDNIKVTMTHTTMSLSLQGYERHPSLKIIYDVPDGVQGAGHPHPGSPYQGDRFEAYLPDNRDGRKLLLLLDAALNQGLTFKIQSMGSKDKVTWNNIPHKTSPDGGKIKNGYPDSYYIKNVYWQLKENGIE